MSDETPTSDSEPEVAMLVGVGVPRARPTEVLVNSALPLEETLVMLQRASEIVRYRAFLERMENDAKQRAPRIMPPNASVPPWAKRR